MGRGELRVFTPTLRPIGTMWPVKAVNVAWQRTGSSTATFTIPQTGPRWSPGYVRHLNRVEYHHPDLPYVWVGIILSHAPNGSEVAIQCVSAEWLFKRRFTEIELAEIGTGGALARLLLAQATRTYSLGIAPGQIDLSGPEYYAEWGWSEIAKSLDELGERSGGEWWVEKTGHDHNDPWLFRWDSSRGLDRRADVILSGEVVDPPDYRSTAEDLATALYLVGMGSGPELWKRIHYYIQDKAAIQVYGLVEDLVEFNDIDDDVLLLDAGYKELARRSRPARTLGVNVDNRKGQWGAFWLGDTVRAILRNVGYNGFDGAAIVQAIQIDVDSGRMGLVVELVD